MLEDELHVPPSVEPIEDEVRIATDYAVRALAEGVPRTEVIDRIASGVEDLPVGPPSLVAAVAIVSAAEARRADA